MFFRVKQSGPRTYLQIVDNIRKEGQVRQRVLTTLGRLFRGATAYPRGKGVWRDDQRGGTLLAEEPVIVFSYVASSELTVEALTRPCPGD